MEETEKGVETSRTEEPLRRQSVEAVDHHEQYLVRDRTFGEQFSGCYASRLRELEPAVRAQLTPAEAAACTRVADLRGDGHAQTLVGTLVKVARRLPNLLAEYAAARVITGFRWAHGAVYVDPADELYLEDASGRVRVVFESKGNEGEEDDGNKGENKDGKEEKEDKDDDDDPTREYPTGVVVGLVGVYDAGTNRFVVPRVGGVRTAGPRLCELASGVDGDGDDGASAAELAARGHRFVLLVSGLRFGSARARPLCAHALAQWLAGNIGGAAERTLAASVVRVIIAGDSIAVGDDENDGDSGDGNNKDGKDGDKKKEDEDKKRGAPKRTSTALLSEALEALDDVLTGVAASCAVDVMPGPRDPANSALPQQPVERLLLPAAAAFASCRLVTNPHTVTVAGTVFTGTAGQNVDNLAALTAGADRLTLLQRTYEWRHAAPTAPDTLGCFPAHDRDRLVLGAAGTPLPHVYFAGNQPAFATRAAADPRSGARVRLVLVPVFAHTGTAVLVDTATHVVRTLTIAL